MQQFTCHDVADLCYSREALKWFEAQLLCDPSLFQEAVHALCSQLTRGKDLSSPTKRIKLRANKIYFAKLAGFMSEVPHASTSSPVAVSSSSRKTLGNSFTTAASSSSFTNSSSSSSYRKAVKSETVIISPRSTLYGAPPPSSPLYAELQRPEDLERSVSVVDFSRALATQSKRWASIPADEILSLTLLIDSCADGLSDGQVSTNDFLSFSKKVDDCLCSLRGANAAEHNEAFALLYETLVAERIERSREELQRRAPPELTLRLLDDSLVERLRSFANDSRILKRNPLTELNNILLYTPSHARLQAVLDMFRGLGIAVLGDDTSSEMRARADICAQVDMRYDSEMRFDASFDSRRFDTPRSVGGVVNSVNASPGFSTQFQQQQQQQQQQPAATAAMAAASLDIDESMARLRENATSIAAKLASQSDSLDSTMSIWSALQNLESELKKAVPGATIPPAAIATLLSPQSSSPASSTAKSKSQKAKTQNSGLDKTIEQNLSTSVDISMSSLAATPRRPSSSPAVLRGGKGARGQQSGGSEMDLRGNKSNGASAADQTTKMTSGSHQFATPILAQRARERVASRNGKATTPLPFQPASNSQLPRGFSTAPPQRPRPTSSSSSTSDSAEELQRPAPAAQRQTARSQPTARTTLPSNRANLSIFKSPGRRQLSDNVNTYDANSSTWRPTQISNKQGRFQSTHDLMEGRKLFSIFFQQDPNQ